MLWPAAGEDARHDQLSPDIQYSAMSAERFQRSRPGCAGITMSFLTEKTAGDGVWLTERKQQQPATSKSIQSFANGEVTENPKNGMDGTISEVGTN